MHASYSTRCIPAARHASARHCSLPILLQAGTAWPTASEMATLVVATARLGGDHGDDAANPGQPAAYLLRTSTGEKFGLPPGETVIGRVEPADVVVADAAAISSRHARIAINDETRVATLTDLTSSNGSRLLFEDGGCAATCGVSPAFAPHWAARINPPRCGHQAEARRSRGHPPDKLHHSGN